MVKVGTYHGEANPPGRREPGYVIDNVLQPAEESLGDRLWRSHPIIMAALTGCAAFRCSKRPRSRVFTEHGSSCGKSETKA